MDLIVKRKTRTPLSTTGDFFVNGNLFCHTLEDPDRGLRSDMPLDQIAAAKVHGNTCIPSGKYQVSKYFSPKHGGWVPLLLHVPGFEYVEIHVGNYPKDTEGCLLLGNTVDKDFVGDSKTAVKKFYDLFFPTLANNEQVWITYE